MKMRNFDAEFVVRRYWPFIKPDCFNHTSLFLNGTLVWPSSLEGGQDVPVLPAPEVMFRLEIPSGVLMGVIQGITVINGILEAWWIVKCTWIGKFAGLAAGNSSLGNVRYFTRPETVVESSISEKPLTYAEYIAVHRMVEAITRGSLDQEVIRLWPDENWELMKTALGYLRALREDARRLCDEK